DILDTFRAKFKEALDQDLNTSLAVTVLYDVLKAEANASTKLALLSEFDRVLDLNLLENAKATKESAPAAPAADDAFIAEIEQAIKERAEAKKAKEYAKADAIRAALAQKGVTLTDTPSGTTYTIA
ncbi:MAG: cysteine--tRNA ligase, partial [Clostridia bacterium]|nr:cysteine--tRNA ligase [Clostridia bacterium]